MEKLVCFRHKGYDGTTKPDLDCETCCAIFVARIRHMQANGIVPKEEDLIPARKRKAAKQAKTNFGFDPSLI